MLQGPLLRWHGIYGLLGTEDSWIRHNPTCIVLPQQLLKEVTGVGSRGLTHRYTVLYYRRVYLTTTLCLLLPHHDRNILSQLRFHPTLRHCPALDCFSQYSLLHELSCLSRPILCLSDAAGLDNPKATFYLFMYHPRKLYLQRAATHPTPIYRKHRRILFQRCHESIPNLEHYLSKWFIDALALEIK